jgi:AraC-like DNA-binding protein
MRFELPPTSMHTKKEFAVIPQKYESFRLPHFNLHVVTSDVADIIYQERTVGGCFVCHILFHVHRACVLKPTVQGPFSAINFMLQGSVEVMLYKNVKVMLYQGQYNAYQVNQQEHVAYFKPGLYEAMHFDYSREFLASLACKDDTVKHWLELIDANDAGAVMPNAGIITPELFQLLQKIKHPALHGQWIADLFMAKLKEVLILTISMQQVANPNNQLLDPKYETIRTYILNNLGEEITIPKLAKSYCMSESKLKKDFTKYFDMSFTQFLKESRMNRAQYLIQEQSKSIADVAYELGYQYPGSLSREYKRFFGHPPSAGS